MEWKPIDFQGIIALDSPLIDLLQRYLDEKEEHLASSILEAIPPAVVSLQAPVLPPNALGHFKLTDAMEALVKRNYQNSQTSQISQADWDAAITKINAALWDYVETIFGLMNKHFFDGSNDFG